MSRAVDHRAAVTVFRLIIDLTIGSRPLHIGHNTCVLDIGREQLPECLDSVKDPVRRIGRNLNSVFSDRNCVPFLSERLIAVRRQKDIPGRCIRAFRYRKFIPCGFPELLLQIFRDLSHFGISADIDLRVRLKAERSSVRIRSVLQRFRNDHICLRRGSIFRFHFHTCEWNGCTDNRRR